MSEDAEEHNLPIPAVKISAEERSFMPPAHKGPRMTSSEWQSSEDQRFRENVESIAESLRDIASFTSFAKKWTPWLIAFIGVAWPSIGKIIQQLPPIPH